MHAADFRVQAESIRVVVADARGPERLRCRLALSPDDGFTVVAEAVDADQLLAVVGFAGPDVVVLDASLPNEHGVDLVAELAARAPHAGVLVNLVEPGEDTDLQAAVLRAARR
jgi:DNA-binding NarL/FixJ family response regulator